MYFSFFFIIPNFIKYFIIFQTIKNPVTYKKIIYKLNIGLHPRSIKSDLSLILKVLTQGLGTTVPVLPPIEGILAPKSPIVRAT